MEFSKGKVGWIRGQDCVEARFPICEQRNNHVRFWILICTCLFSEEQTEKVTEVYGNGKVKYKSKVEGITFGQHNQ